MVNQKAFDIANQFTGKALAGRHLEFTHNEPMLEHGEILFDATPHPLMLIVRVPAAAHSRTVRFP